MNTLPPSLESEELRLVWVILGSYDTDNFVDLVILVALIAAASDVGGVDRSSV